MTTEEILTSIMGFLYASSIDLNMGYPLILLNGKARKILMIVMPFGAYECLTLPMGVMPTSDLFRAKMVHIFAPMKSLRPFPYIDAVLHFKGGTFEEHLKSERLDCKSARKRVDSARSPWNTSDSY